MNKVMLSASDIMKKIGIGRDKAYELLKSGQFHTIKLGRKYYVHEDVFDNWLKGISSNKRS